MDADVSRLLRRHWSRLGLGLFAFLTVSILTQTLAVFLAGLLAPRLLREGWFLTMLSFVCMYLVGFPVLLAVLPKPPAAYPEKRSLGDGTALPIYFLMCMGILYPCNLLGTGVNSLLGDLLGSSIENPLEDFIQRLDLWSVCLFAVVLAPVMEEIIFRKLLMDRMRTIDAPGAVLFSALAFALCHGNLSQFFYAFGVGLLFGSIYARTGRLRYSVILHILVNFVGSMLPLLLLQDADLESLQSVPVGPEAADMVLRDLPAFLGLGAFGLFVICGTGAGIALLILRRRELSVRRPEDRLRTPGAAFRTMFLNGGFIAFLIVAAIQFASAILMG
jgi:membrane protease YdiL (CAAX protease family)